MKLTIDTDNSTVLITDGEQQEEVSLYSDRAFELISDQWVKVGWNQKHSYTFTWMGRPLIQLPEDLVRVQELIFQLRPDVIIETGVAHGGSLIFYASLLSVIGKGRVVGVDIEIRPHNRQAIEENSLAHLITLIEGSSIDPDVVRRAGEGIKDDDVVLVILDSCHTKDHVAQELELYHPYVTKGSYIIATDGIMKDLYDVPRGSPEWRQDNPTAAAKEFAATHPEFELGQPAWLFNESELKQNITHWPGAHLRRTE